MRNITLIGMPGAGKSTVGVLLAKSLKRPFLDTDLVIQTRTDRYLQEIIDTEGMEAFLDLEAEIVTSLAVEGHVIATGGSVIYREATMHHLQQTGTLVFLQASFQAIEQRLQNIATRGIATRPGQTLRDLYQERQPRYAQWAHLTVITENRTPEDVVTEIARRVLG